MPSPMQYYPSCTPRSFSVELAGLAGLPFPTGREKEYLISSDSTSMPPPSQLFGLSLLADALLNAMGTLVAVFPGRLSFRPLHVSFLACRPELDIDNGR